MTFPHYPEYKESGIAWLSDLPEHWDVKRLKQVSDVQLSNVDKHSIEDQPSVRLCNYVDVYKNERITSAIQFMQATASSEQVARLSLMPGDVIITKDSEDPSDIGVPACVTETIPDLVCGYHLALVRPRGAAGTYLYYLFKSDYVRAMFEVEATGMTRYALGKYSIENLTHPAPPLDEQIAIAEFLDRETGKIDALVADQEKLIALLKEKRQAVITHAVTKGLAPNVPMKDSGIEWLGEVPEHWEVVRIGNLFREVADAGAEDRPILSVSIHDGVSDRELDENEMDRKVTRSDDRSKYKAVEPDDLVYNMMRAWQGGFGTVQVAGMVSPAYVVARPIRKFSTLFVEQQLRSPQAVEEMRRHSRGVTDFRLRLYWEEFKAISVVLAPNEEQAAIAIYLDRETAKIDALTAEAQHAIELLKERRSALISAAVTGKIDVRGLVATDAREEARAEAA